MELVLLILIAGLVIAALSATRRLSTGGQRQRQRQIPAAAVESVRRAADEDVTVFGEELTRLDTDLAGRALDEGTRADYQRALDAYEAAKQSAAALTEPEQMRHVAEILADGRYATSCVRARVAGQPLPQRRAPCFFNPQHGPSVVDVPWTPPGGTQRQVPACALDAERVRAGAEPDTRQVMMGPARVPYWQAGPAFAPYAFGYFGAFGLMETMFLGTMMGGMLGGGFGGGYDSGYDQGYDDGADQGDGGDGGYDGGDGGYDGGDGGGFDGGGFDGGGFDGGGFDGGGFDV